MTQRLALATSNRGKIAELQALFKGWQLYPQDSLRISAAQETATSFIENALLKARHVAQQAKMPAMADDSGLEVDALDGAPGVYSARFAGAAASDQDNIDKLISALADLPLPQRRARFRCVMVVLRHPHDPAPLIAQGVWEGHICSQARGSNGFGYDPVFEITELGLTAAELKAEQKNQLSHRAQAVRELRSLLANFTY